MPHPLCREKVFLFFNKNQNPNKRFIVTTHISYYIKRINEINQRKFEKYKQLKK